MQKNKALKFSELIEDTAFFLIVLMFVTLIATNILFLLHITLSPAVSAVSFVLSFAVFYAAVRKRCSLFYIVSCYMASCILIAAAVLLCSKWIDYSYDTLTLYKTAVGLLKRGWNPMYMSAEDAFIGHFGIHSSMDAGYVGKWIDNYANACELLQTHLYMLNGYADSGIALIWLTIFSVFGMGLRLLRTHGVVGIKAFLAAFFLVFNPVVLPQTATLYTDGPWTLFLELLILMMFVFAADRWDITAENGLIFVMSFTLSSAMKMNAFAYCSFFVIVFYLYTLFCMRHGFSLKDRRLVMLTVLCCLCPVLTVFGTGMSVYGKNLVIYHNLFRGFLGDGAENLIAYDQIVPAFRDMPSWKSFWISMFSRCSSSMKSEVVLKIPFIVSLSELEAFLQPDVRVAGFGPLYSGIFLISCGILIAAIWKMKDQILKGWLACICIISLILAMVLPGTYWLRYVSFITFFAVYALIILLKEKDRITKKAIVFMLLMFANGLCCWGGTAHKIIEMSSCRQRILLIGEKKYEKVYVQYTQAGALFNLEDYDVSYEIVDEEESADYLCPRFIYTNEYE